MTKDIDLGTAFDGKLGAPRLGQAMKFVWRYLFALELSLKLLEECDQSWIACQEPKHLRREGVEIGEPHLLSRFDEGISIAP
jgi:hypothetical protein